MARQACRRRVVLGGGAAGATALLAACAGGGTQPAAQTADLKGVAVEFWTWNPATHPESLGTQKVMGDFGAKNPQGITVTFTAPGTGGQATYEKYAAALTAGTPPDAAIGQHFYMSDLQRQGGLVDVEAELKSNADWKKAKGGLTPELIAGYIPMPNFPGFGDVRTMGDKMIPDIWNGQGTARQVLDEYTRLAQQRLDDVLKA